MISIHNYEERHQAGFRELNLYWLDHYKLTEQHDLDILDDPFGKIIRPGGSLFIAMDGEQVVGTVGIIPEKGEVFELVKMTVHPDWQGRGIGKQLLEHALGAARKAGGKKVYLFSNSQLRTALRMYEKHGFQSIPVKDSPMVTADVKMELILS